MKISELDKNFRIEKCDASKFKIYDIPSPGFKLYGVLHEEDGFFRIDKKNRENQTDGVKWLQRHTSGGRVVFSTNSKRIYIKAEYYMLEPMNHMAPTGCSGFNLVKVKNGKYQYRGIGHPTIDNNSFKTVINVQKGHDFEDYIVYMPLYNNVKSLSIGVDLNADIKETNIYKDIAPILYYGNSVTQGGCASRPDNCYQSYISEKFGVDYINLGFSGNGRAEDKMIEYLSNNFNPSVFVMDYDHNAPDSIYLKKTHSKLFLSFRKKHPNTPVIMISKFNYFDPNESIIESRKRKQIIMDTYQTALDSGDKNVYFIDGSKVFPRSIREHCTVDCCHPTDLGFYYIAKAIIKVIEQNELL